MPGWRWSWTPPGTGTWSWSPSTTWADGREGQVSATIEPEIGWVQEGLDHLATLVDPSLPGWSRTGFSVQDVEGRHWVAQQMRAAGLSTHVDAVGNVIGTFEGTAPAAPAIVVGSHSDTVPGGGRFDGIVGVLGAIEVARALRRTGTRLTHELRIVDFANEEGNPQGVKLVGSRAIAGTLGHDHLQATDEGGVSLADLISRAGHSPEKVHTCRWDRAGLAAYLELHIEQGPVLERNGAGIGVVTRVCGISTFHLDVHGRRDHAGTTPMDTRSDAMCCGAAAVLAVQRIAAAGSDTVGTVGALTTTSPLTNVISNFARVTGEFRSPHMAGLRALAEELEADIPRLDAAHRTTSSLSWGHTDPPAVMDRHLSDVVVGAAATVGHEAVRLYSGATHDSVQMSQLAPAGMIFVPSAGGRSHCPEEWTELTDIERGVRVLIQAVLDVDTGFAGS
ncbi:M20 family metallo-hydrolase [Georgenia yuyongxinii]|uniref:M20 family metallo-hydrolase n=1 Tax=Georgenia yuyongxinii TaxID=2589797 RepID=A0A552WPV6_9MICO|nr:M20 family metallo-hydrolase [Georgenia yuyongxinii]